MLTVHHLGTSQSERIVWLCEELELSYSLKCYARDPTTRAAPAEYKGLHPFGTAPVITDGDLVLAESGAIIEYLLARYGGGRLAPSPTQSSFAEYLFWFHWANGSMMPRLMIDMFFGATGASGAFADTMRARAEQSYAFIERRLSQAPYLAGAQFTAADIMSFFALTTMRLFKPRDMSPYPNTRAYVQRVGERPAYRRAMQKADPDLPAPLL
jgi:glutathione S-transferase